MNIITICGNKGTGKSTTGSILVDDFGFVEVAYADEFKRLCKSIFTVPNEFLFGPSHLRDSKLEESVGHELTSNYWVSCHKRIDKLTPQIQEIFGERCLDPVTSLQLMVSNDFSKNKDVTVRHMLQQMGTEWGRALWPHVWNDVAFRVIKKLDKGNVSYTQKDGIIDTNGASKKISGIVITDARYPDGDCSVAIEAGSQLWWIDASKRIKQHRTLESVRHSSEPDFDAFEDLKPTIINNNDTIDDLKHRIKKLMSK